MRHDPSILLGRLSTLSDFARLRIMRLLEQEELSVGELARALQLPQSTVSRHLKMLSDGGWITRRAEGTASLYRLDESQLDDGSRELWQVMREQLGPSPTFEEDDTRLTEVIAGRRADSKAFFGRIGGEWDELRRELFGSDFTAEALLNLLDETWVVADLGCGTGNAAELLAPHVSRVIAVDREPAMIDAAHKRLADNDQIEFRQGELTALPIEDAAVDAAVTLLVLHHLPEPAEVVQEAARVLRPGGVLLIVDMVAHDRDTYRQTMGHVHLGFSHEAVEQWARDASLTFVHYRRLRPDPAGKGPGLFVATMRRPR